MHVNYNIRQQMPAIMQILSTITDRSRVLSQLSLCIAELVSTYNYIHAYISPFLIFACPGLAMFLTSIGTLLVRNL